MPRYPIPSETVQGMPAGVFSKVAHRIAQISGERYPLHVGDTWLEPAAGCHMADFSESTHPRMHTYAPPRGHAGLLDAIAERHRVSESRVIVSAGATGGLGAVACATVAPGEEVLILSPFWPLIRGIVTLHHGRPVEVPVLDAVTPEDYVNALNVRLTPATAALYLNTPNNPTGRILSRPVLEAIADFARQHDLWIWSDEVYEGIVFEGEVVPMADVAPERTFSVYSFSKTFGMAGNRCGYIIGPSDEMMASTRKATVHHFYSACTASQLAAEAVLREGRGWLDEAVGHYRRAGYAAADRLGLDRPTGGTFLFVPVHDALDDRGLQGFLEDCIDRGLILAPGSSCGADYGDYVRLCYTSAPPDVVGRGVGVLADLLGR